jgi:hypothetical protein
MKAVRQLIDYFNRRGALSRKQIKQLVASGYWGHYSEGDLRSLEKRIGESFVFNVTGNTHGPLWGTDTYTSDSNLGTACVHAGLLRPGEEGVVEVTMVKPVAVFSGSSRHGVTSQSWTSSWTGAYRLNAVQR